MLHKRQLFLITGVGGSRKDFVTGWISTLDCVDSLAWSIDLTTGCSKSEDLCKNLDTGGYTLAQLLRESNITLDATATQLFVGGCHGNNLSNQEIDTYIHDQSLKIFYIDTSSVDMDTIKWEFSVKTWITNRRYSPNVNQPNFDVENLIAKSDITDQDRILKADKLIKHFSFYGQFEKYQQRGVGLDYTKLFKPGGSYYLCEQLGISATLRQHDFWNAMLPFAQSPDEIVQWGHTWRKQDYFNKLL